MWLKDSYLRVIKPWHNLRVCSGKYELRAVQLADFVISNSKAQWSDMIMTRGNPGMPRHYQALGGARGCEQRRLTKHSGIDANIASDETTRPDNCNLTWTCALWLLGTCTWPGHRAA